MADRPVWPLLVIVFVPILHISLRVRKAEEPMGVEALRPESAVEGLDERVVCRLAWPREVKRDTVWFGFIFARYQRPS